ncbi:MAG: phosphatidate cytidylyltransferase [Candidatus Omnitrophota bacterium]
MLNKRILSSLILIIITVLSIIYNWLLIIVATTLIVLGLLEFYNMAEKKGIPVYKYFGVVIGATIPLSIFFKFELTKGWELLFVVLLLVVLFLLQFLRRDNSGATAGISVTLFGILYISWFFSFVLKIKNLAFGSGVLASLIFITKSGDIGAYLIGSKWGVHALIPRISPKKSVEGTMGGLLFNVLAAMGSKIFLPFFSYFHLACLGFLLGIIGQFGDLSESLIKRDCQTKDASGVFPGMGGVLDILDSLLFTAPAFYFYMSIMLNK